MNAGLNFANGLNQVLNTATSYIDKLDQRESRQRAELRQSQLGKEMRQDRQTEREYLAKQRGRQEEEYQANKPLEDAQREHAMGMLPIQRQIAERQAAGAELTVRQKQTQLRITQQQERAQQSSSLIRKGFQQLEGGDMEGAAQTYAELEQYGYNVKEMSADGGQRMFDTVNGLVKGELQINSPEAVEMTKQLLTPALVQSGRDTDRFEIAGLTPTGKGTFFVNMLDKQTGEIKPATLDASPDEDDEPTQVTMEDLMNGAKGFIEMSKGAMASQFKVAGAQYGMDFGGEQVSAYDKARIAKLNAETDNIKGKGELEAIERKYKKLDRQTNSYEDTPKLRSAASILIDQQGMSPEQARDYIVDVAPLADEFPEASGGELLGIHKNRLSIQKKKEGLFTNTLSENPGIDENKLLELVEDRLINNPSMTDAKFKERVKQLRSQVDRKKKAKNNAEEKYDTSAKRLYASRGQWKDKPHKTMDEAVRSSLDKATGSKGKSTLESLSVADETVPASNFDDIARQLRRY